ncbi:enolase-like domain-containing protein [Halocatena halophila]|uniref:hypothetical protein n=1 Tax=Halocatena halophila TaxID=2814576 RepID=UPI002ED1CFE2
MSFEQVADLEFRVDDTELTQRKRATSSGFPRTTTVVSLHGDDEIGKGEDVTYETVDHEHFLAAGPPESLTGEWTIETFSEHVSSIELFEESTPSQSVFRNYRQWAFESAALDLALKQAGTDLGTQLGRSYEPVRFVVSTRLQDPPTGDRVTEWLDRDPTLEFKLDPTSAWTDTVVERLRATGAVRTVDLKGQYHGTEVDQPADPELYERVIEGFPSAVIEDPALTESTRALFDGHESRVSWDYPIRGIETIEALPWEPAVLNIKPSRFGSVRSLLETLAYCEERSIQLYGGGQFELDVGREQLHAIASLFYPDSPNDVAPKGYNLPEPSGELPSSPLDPPSRPRGFEWRDSA